MAKITAKLETCNVEMLKEMAERLNSMMSAEADIVFGAVMNALMSRMDEPSFVAFCEKLEA